jgi:membrane protein YqaA with SNARE-associated domain
MVSVDKFDITNRNVDLVLVDTMPDLDKQPFPLWETLRRYPFQSILHMEMGPTLTSLRLPIILEQWDDSTRCMKTFVSRLLRSHTAQSVFSPRAVPRYRPRDGHAGDVIFSLLLAESAWQFTVTNLESTLQRHQYDAARLTDDEAFPKFREFRRQVASAQVLIAEFKQRCAQIVGYVDSWCVDGKPISADDFWLQKPIAPTAPIFGHARSMDVRNLFDSIEKLEGRVGALSQAINDEIQVVIGSVQVEDARTMKRQTEWTVVLAVLAAIYLPMTLVTGIFGMNITEINTDATRPDKWWTVKVWGLVFGATLGIILVYVLARWLVQDVLKRFEKVSKKFPKGPATLKLIQVSLDKAYGRVLPAAVRRWMVRSRVRDLETSSRIFKDLEAQKLE